MDPQSILNELLADYGEQPYAELAVVTAIQRAAAFMHQSFHWRTRGPLFYSDHLLFERIYTEINNTVDGLAEKTIGLSNYTLLDPMLQSHQINGLVQHFNSDITPDAPPDTYVHVGSSIIAQSMALITLARAQLEAKGQLTNGLDNQLQGILDTYETLVYLLKQRAGAT